MKILKNSKNGIWLLLLLGIALILISIFLFIRQVQFLRNAEITEGTVVDFELRYGPGYFVGNFSSHPVISFKTKNLEEVVFTSNLSLLNSRFLHKNDTLKIYYDPQNPQRAYIKSFLNIWFLPVFLLFMGSIALVGYIFLRQK